VRRRYRLYLGAVSALVAGVAFGYGLATRSTDYWFVGSIGLVSAGLLMLSGLSWWRTPSELYDKSKRQGERPLLGELLVRKYKLITEDELELALAQQRKTHRRLGVELVRMGLLTLPQLAGLLEEQLASQASAPPPAPPSPPAPPEPQSPPEPAPTSSVAAQVR